MIPLETKSAEAGADGPRRADARRNRERVLVAAEAVFAESGVKAPVEEVARRAGVGVGTVCRNFPTKQALIEAVVGAMYESLVDEIEAANAEPDPARAFERFVLGLPDVPGPPSCPRRPDGERDHARVRRRPAREGPARDVGARRPGPGRGRDPRRHRARRRVDAVLGRRARDRRSRATCSPCCASASCASSSTVCGPTTRPRSPGARSTSRSCAGSSNAARSDRRRPLPRPSPNPRTSIRGVGSRCWSCSSPRSSWCSTTPC